MLPQKLFFRIGEVAELVGVEPHVLRYWEREFRSIRPTKSAKGQRVYSRRDVENLLRVRDLLYRDGFTIAGAKKKLKRDDDSPGVDASVAEAREEDGVESGVELAPVANAAESAHSVDETSTSEVRQKLLALRSEVEAFLSELSGRR